MRISVALLSRYFKRYIEREVVHPYMKRIWNPISGWKEIYQKEFYYDEHRPWTAEFKRNNMPGKFIKRIPVQPIKEWNIFKGDRVEILVGKDKGKQGLVNCIIKERNWIYVEGLNCKYNMQNVGKDLPLCVKVEQPLLVTTQVKLVDPADNLPTAIDWRYTDKGEKIRVSTRSGRIIPLPSGAQELEDMVNPLFYTASEKDTLEEDVLEVTFKPKLCSVETELNEILNIKDDRTLIKTHWY